MAVLQWTGRANILFAILAYVPEVGQLARKKALSPVLFCNPCTATPEPAAGLQVQKAWPVFITFWAWSLSEAIRYC